jgi:hypothetical protein
VAAFLASGKLAAASEGAAALGWTGKVSPVGEYGFPFCVGELAVFVGPGVVDVVTVWIAVGSRTRAWCAAARGVVIPARMFLISRALSLACSAIWRALYRAPTDNARGDHTVVVPARCPTYSFLLGLRRDM